MRDLDIINNGLETSPILVESSSIAIKTSSDVIQVYIGRDRDYVKLGSFEKTPAFSLAFNDSFANETIHIDNLYIGSFIKLTSAETMTFASINWTGKDLLLLKPKEISLLARPIFTDESKTLMYIQEAEQNNIKTILGDDLFLRLKAGEEKLLLNGGTYQRGGKNYYLNGVKKALAYYTYSRLIESSSVNLTRQGAVNRRSDSSDEASREDLIRASRETYAIADRYMEECLTYINGNSKNNVTSKRTTIKIIGK